MLLHARRRRVRAQRLDRRLERARRRHRLLAQQRVGVEAGGRRAERVAPGLLHARLAAEPRERADERSAAPAPRARLRESSSRQPARILEQSERAFPPSAHAPRAVM